MSESECLRLGFNPTKLDCIFCDLLDGYGLLTLRKSCLKCCNEIMSGKKESENNGNLDPKYPKAVLEVCSFKLELLPHLEDFLSSKRREKYGNLIEEYVEGSWPSISLINEDGSVDRSYSITKWSGDIIAEFLDTFLVQ